MSLCEMSKPSRALIHVASLRPSRHCVASLPLLLLKATASRSVPLQSLRIRSTEECGFRNVPSMPPHFASAVPASVIASCHTSSSAGTLFASKALGVANARYHGDDRGPAMWNRSPK